MGETKGMEKEALLSFLRRKAYSPEPFYLSASKQEQAI